MEISMSTHSSATNPRHATEPWKNHFREIYISLFGQKAFDENFTTELPPQPEPSLRNQARLFGIIGLIAFGFTLKMLRLQMVRGTHSYTGVGAQGTATLLNNPDIPYNEFLSNHKMFRCSLRHARLVTKTDVEADIVSSAIKFVDENERTVLDLAMNTGKSSLFYNLITFIASSKVARKVYSPEYPKLLKELVYKFPLIFKLKLDAIRRTPDSLHNLSFYSHVNQHYQSNDGATRYVRFRMIPTLDHQEDDGMVAEKFQWVDWDFSRADDEYRSDTYLRDEFKARLAKETLTYYLQIQIHEWKSSDKDEIFCASIPWDEATHPWHTVARLDFDEALTDEQAENLTFNPAHCPPSLGVIKAYSPEDYNSVNYARTILYPFLQKIRLLGAKFYNRH